MTQHRTVSIDPESAWDVRSIVRATAATVPESYRIVEARGDVVVVDGHGLWPERVLAVVEDGADAVVVLRPRLVQQEFLASVLDLRVPVVLSPEWLHNTTVQRIAPHFQAMESSGSMLEAGAAVQSGEHLSEAVLALALTAQELLGASIEDLHVVATTAHHLMVFGRTQDLLVRLNAVVGPGTADEAWFRLVGSTGVVTATVPPSQSGASGTGKYLDCGVQHTLEYAFESTNRSTLLFAAECLSNGTIPNDVAAFDAVTRNASADLWRAPELAQ